MMELELESPDKLPNEIKGPDGYFEISYQYLMCHSIAIVINNKLTKGWVVVIPLSSTPKKTPVINWGYFNNGFSYFLIATFFALVT